MNANTSTAPLTPVLVIGAGRSGTKLLRDLLAASDEVSRVPYDVSYVWRTGNETTLHDEFKPAQASNVPNGFVPRTLEKMARADAVKPRARIMVEKSVPNALRPAFCNTLMPGARFIHLIRDGRAVTESALRMWQAPRETGHILQKLRYFPLANYRYGLWYAGNLLKSRLSPAKSPPMWGPRYEGIHDDLAHLPLIQVCARQWRRCVEVSRRELAAIPPDRVIELRYEDLVADPAELRRVCRFLGLADENKVIDAFARTATRDSVSKWRKSLTQHEIDAMLDEIGPLVRELGYD